MLQSLSTSITFHTFTCLQKTVAQRCLQLVCKQFFLSLYICVTAAQFGAGLLIADYCHCHHNPAAWKSHQEILGGESLSSSVNAKRCSDKFADEVCDWRRTAPLLVFRHTVAVCACLLCVWVSVHIKNYGHTVCTHRHMHMHRHRQLNCGEELVMDLCLNLLCQCLWWCHNCSVTYAN